MAQDYTKPTGRRGPMDRFLSLEDFERAAERRLPRPIFGYVVGAAEENWSRDANRAAFGAYAFRPRVLRDVSGRSQAVELLGQRWSAPFGIAPMGVAALAAYRADVVMARAAATAGIPFALSGSSLIRLEDVAAAAPGSWFQAYIPGDQTRIDPLVDRVAAAGYETLVITIDVPVIGNRENLARAGFSTPLRPTPRLAWQGITRPQWLIGTFARTLLTDGMPHFENSFAGRGAPVIARGALRDFSGREGLTWAHIAQIRARWGGRLILKGILAPGDARLAVEHGADGIIVSNHGGRQLDSAVAPFRVLPEIVAAVPDTPVMLDSGVRRGSDVLKALALGARFVFLGRPFLYAAAVGGEAGVARAAEILSSEIDRNLALLGLRDVSEMTPEALVRMDEPGTGPGTHI